MKLGIENIKENLHLLKGKRVGLITNPTGIDRNFTSTIDVLKENCDLVCLFSPEHGVRGNYQAGVRFEAYVDEESGILVHSLYTKDKRPTKEMLDSIDVLCIDIQDGGSRFYTYIYTMAYSMMACAEHDKEFVVFDRPNPINAVDFEGNILDLEYRSFVGYYSILQRHGMTIGELAKMFNEEFGIGCNLNIIKMVDYDRTKFYDELELPWVLPSPNYPTINTGIVYNCTCIFEGTNLSEGRGTTIPFEVVGAPYINPTKLASKLNSLDLPGVYFRGMFFNPTFSKHAGVMCGGVQLHILNRKEFKPVHTGWAMLDVIRKMYPNDYQTLKPYKEGGKCMLEFNTGCNYIIEDLYTLEEQFKILEQDTKKFELTRSKYLLY
ncbi:MAG: DUF1343 domain-containing protein [Bacilli bacterium]